LGELNNAAEEFRLHYQQFAKKNSDFVRTEEELNGAFEKAGKVQNINHSAVLFQVEVSAVLKLLERKRQLSASKWTGRLDNFLTKLYPLARLALGQMGAIAQVLRNSFSTNS
jgi:hypothetical protein